MPAFQVPFEYHRLRQGGELVRVEWNKARIKAMKTGQIQMFRYTAQSSTYQVMPYFSQQDWLEADAAHSTGMGTTGANQQMAMATQAADQASSVARELPEGVVFVQSEVETDTRSLRNPAADAGQPDRRRARIDSGLVLSGRDDVGCAHRPDEPIPATVRGGQPAESDGHRQSKRLVDDR